VEGSERRVISGVLGGCWNKAEKTQRGKKITQINLTVKKNEPTSGRPQKQSKNMGGKRPEQHMGVGAGKGPGSDLGEE